MAEVEENWQTKISTVRERTTFVFNNELLSDVKFVVPASNESESKKAKMVIPAHKFMLAISSPVFYSMFFGQLAETSDTIELPDCEYESLLELFRYLYSEEVNLNGNNVMQVFYLAKKYMVPSLVVKCSKYLRDNVKGSNAFSILLHAQKFEDKDLEERCWQVIETHTAEAVTSNEFVTLERSLVETVVKSERLCVKEVELFKAIDCWASKEIERQRISPDGNVKRQIIGEEIVKAIRFPLMSQKEFASVVPDCNILTTKEIVDMMKYYSDVLTTPLPFMQAQRFGSTLRCFRFSCCGWSAVPNPTFREQKIVCKQYCITVITSKTIWLHGVQHYGSADGKCTVDLKIIKGSTAGSVLVKQSGIYVSKKYKFKELYYCFNCFDVLFDRPVCLESGEAYKIFSDTKGPLTAHIIGEIPSVECAGVMFTFRGESGFNGRSAEQFPTLIFTL